MRYFGPLGLLLQFLNETPEVNDPKHLAIDAIGDINLQLMHAGTAYLMGLPRQHPDVEPEQLFEMARDFLGQHLTTLIAKSASSLSYLADIGLEPQRTDVPRTVFHRLTFLPEVTLRVKDASAFLQHAKDAKAVACNSGALKKRISKDDYRKIGALIRKGYWSLDFDHWDLGSPEDDFLKSIGIISEAFETLGIDEYTAFYAAAQESVDQRCIKEFLKIQNFGAFPWTVAPSQILEEAHQEAKLLEIWMQGQHFLKEAYENERARHWVKKVTADLLQSAYDFDYLVSMIPGDFREPFGTARRALSELSLKLQS